MSNKEGRRFIPNEVVIKRFNQQAALNNAKRCSITMLNDAQTHCWAVVNNINHNVFKCSIKVFNDVQSRPCLEKFNNFKWKKGAIRPGKQRGKENHLSKNNFTIAYKLEVLRPEILRILRTACLNGVATRCNIASDDDWKHSVFQWRLLHVAALSTSRTGKRTQHCLQYCVQVSMEVAIRWIITSNEDWKHGFKIACNIVRSVFRWRS